jgi:hypothetical protein
MIYIAKEVDWIFGTVVIGWSVLPRLIAGFRIDLAILGAIRDRDSAYGNTAGGRVDQLDCVVSALDH